MPKNSWGKDAQTACKLFLDYWMSFSSGGEPVLDTLIGMIQRTNMSAVRFVEKLGFVRLGSIPRMLRDAYTAERNDAVILYYLR
jgi:hypothetical protein